MKHLVPFLLFFFFLSHIAIAQSGTPDSTLGGTGRVISLFNNDSLVFGAGTVLQSDGKIIVAGSMKKSPLVSDLSEILVARYKSNGDRDLTFGGGKGYIRKDIDHKSDGGNCVALQSDGKILVGGYATTGIDNDFCVLRLHPNGAIDSSFGTSGYVVTDIANVTNRIYTLLIQPDNKIVAMGNASQSTIYAHAIVRYHPDGNLDSTFGTGGIVTNFGLSTVTGFAIQAQLLPDGKILAAGRDIVQGNSDIAIFRYLSNGSPDSTFGVNGKLTWSIDQSTSETAWNIAIQPDNKIVVTGEASIGSIYYHYIGRFDADFMPDTDFGNNGYLLIPKAELPDQLNSIAIQPNGKISLSGCSYVGIGSLFLTKQLNASGTIDSTFGVNGEVITSFNINQQCGYAMALSPDNTLLAVGTGTKNGKYSILLARYLLEGLNVGYIDFENNTNNVLISPNPVKENNLLRFSLNHPETLSIELVDIQGRTVKKYTANQLFEAGDHEVNIPVDASMPQGLWFLMLRSERGMMTIKIVK